MLLERNLFPPPPPPPPLFFLFFSLFIISFYCKVFGRSFYNYPTLILFSYRHLLMWYMTIASMAYLCFAMYFWRCVDVWLNGAASKRCPVGESDCDDVTAQNVIISLFVSLALSCSVPLSLSCAPISLSFSSPPPLPCTCVTTTVYCVHSLCICLSVCLSPFLS